MDKEAIAILGFFAIVFGGLILLNNPINFQQFPMNVSPNAWFGLIIFVGGLFGVYFGLK